MTLFTMESAQIILAIATRQHQILVFVQLSTPNLVVNLMTIASISIT